MYDVIPYVLHFCSYRVFVYNRLNFLIRSVISSVNYLFNSVERGIFVLMVGLCFVTRYPPEVPGINLPSARVTLQNQAWPLEAVVF
jgi:hypothetical protein